MTSAELTCWMNENAGKPGASQARLLIKSHLKGHATLEKVLLAIAEYEKASKVTAKRRQAQCWISPNFPLEDGRVYENIRVWQPDRGEVVLEKVRFVVSATRGQALYHVLVNDGQQLEKKVFSRKVGSFVEVE